MTFCALCLCTNAGHYKYLFVHCFSLLKTSAGNQPGSVFSNILVPFGDYKIFLPL